MQAAYQDKGAGLGAAYHAERDAEVRSCLQVLWLICQGCSPRETATVIGCTLDAVDAANPAGVVSGERLATIRAHHQVGKGLAASLAVQQVHLLGQVANRACWAVMDGLQWAGNIVGVLHHFKGS